MNTTQEQWLPIINASACNSCGDCVVACPTAALAMDGGAPVLAWPERCGYCAVCEAVCPTEAVVLPYQIVMAAGVG